MTLSDIFILFGGVGLFLYGMTRMSTGLKRACGDQLKTILEKATRNRVLSVLAGVAVTVLVQSSSATDVMVIGFVTSGLMNLTQALGVIMGANIGTTVTAQVTAFNIGMYAPLLLFGGAVMTLFLKKRVLRDVGTVVLGFGMLFQGITMMKSAIAPLSETPAFISIMSRLSNPIVTVLFGLLFTALLQSSSSSTVIFQAFAVEGLISYDTAVYLVIGAAIGSVMPNLLAGLTANRQGKRCAILNLVFNLMRAALVLILITVWPGCLDLIRRLSPDSVARQIANTHTIFALISVVALLPVSPVIIKIAEKIVPTSREEEKQLEDRRLVYLTQTERIPAAIALDQAHREIARMGHLAVDNLATSIDCFFTADEQKTQSVLTTEQTVDYLARAIVDKLVELRANDISQRNLNRLYRMIQAVDDIERVSDHAENITEYATQLQNGSAVLSDEGLTDMRSLCMATMQSMRLCLHIFENESYDLLNEAVNVEEHVDDVKDEIVNNHMQRLMKDSCDPQGGVIFTDMAIDLERCSDHALKIARALSD
ncbi:MAG: Na/Pi cotransporter family protein [Clostridia bacterium]|nr:Na/Pi cotransporter family protein [Clostridia bacterium]